MAAEPPFTLFLEKPNDRPSPSLGLDSSDPIQPNTGPAPTVMPSELPQPVVNSTGSPSSPYAPSDSVSPDEIVQAVIDTRKFEERARRPTTEGAYNATERYHLRYDFNEKAGWQSKKVSPKLSIAVERLVATISRIREKTKSWFTVEAIDEHSAVYYNFVKTLLRFFLDHDEVNFGKTFREALKCGLLQQMMATLITWENGEGHATFDETPDVGNVEGSAFSANDAIGSAINASTSDDSSNPVVILPGSKQGKLRIENLNPDYVFLDSSNRGNYTIWCSRPLKGEAYMEGTDVGWDMEALDRALHKPGTSTTASDTMAGFHEAQDAAKQDKTPDYEEDNKVLLTNFFGTLYDRKTGRILFKNKYCLIAGDSELVYGPVDNPFWDGGCPVVTAPIIEVPFSAYGRSPIVWNLDMYDLWNEYLNLLIDYMQSVLMGIKEIDEDIVEDESTLYAGGLYPGKVIRTLKNGQPNVQAVTNVPFSDVPQGFWQHMQILQKELSDNVLLADTIGGADRTRGRITALEFNRRATDAGAMIDFIFTAIEDNYLSKALRLSIYRILQFMSQDMWKDWIDTHSQEIAPSDPELKAKWDAVFEDLKSWDPQTRWKKLSGVFKFKVKVFSALGDQQMEIEKGTYMMQTVGQIPGAAQWIRWDKLMRHLVKAFGWDPEEIVAAEALPLPLVAMQTGNVPLMNALAQQQQEGDALGDQPSIGAPTSLSTSPPFAPSSQGAPGPGAPPSTGTSGPKLRS